MKIYDTDIEAQSLYPSIHRLVRMSAIIILYYARWQHKNTKNTAVKIKKTHNYRRKIKRKTIKSKSQYASRASPNGPLNIYVAGMPWKNMID